MGPRSEALNRKYQFEYEVGLWAFGTIEVLKDRETSALKTCKTAKKTLIRNPAEAVARLQRLQGLQHQHICSVSDVLEDKDNIFIISDKTQGNDVAEWMGRTFEEGNWIQEPACAAYIREVLSAVAHCHSNRICHRELRPGTLLLTTKLPDASVKVVDFGVADILDPSQAMLRKNATPYTAPELFGEREPGFGGFAASAAADVWSIGAIAHMLLVGQPPPRERASRAWNILGRGPDEAAWAERSPASQDFVQGLLSRRASRRMTAAKALKHPWLRGAATPTRVGAGVGNSAEGDVSHRTLCYMLSVLLLPEVLEFKNLHQIRSAFGEIDDDRDGLVTSSRVQDLLLDRGLPRNAAAASVNVADVFKTGVLDLCSVAVAELIARECGDAALGAADLAPRLLKRFFGIYGNGQQFVVSPLQLRNRLCTAAGREVEVRAGVSFDEILTPFEGREVVDSHTLVAELAGGGGRGTPLGEDNQDPVEPEEDGGWGITLGLPSVDDFLAQMFQTCGRCGSNPSPGAKLGNRSVGRLVSAFQY